MILRGKGLQYPQTNMQKNIEEQYLDLVKDILGNGELKHNRTGIDAITIPGYMLQHDMSQGFPLLTTKKMGIKNIAAELEFFIKGLKDKQWLKDRGCHIWDEWCNPQKIPYGNDEITKQKMAEENDLGDIYGVVWRGKSEYQKIDQLKSVVDTLKKNLNDRRMLCSAWSPMDKPSQALPPCHILWQVTVINNKLNLFWYQRSCDVMLGIPYNIASYSLLLKLLAKESNLQEGVLTGFLADTHIYVNHRNGALEQISRQPRALPQLEITNFTSIFGWKYTDINLINYNPHPSIKFEVAV